MAQMTIQDVRKKYPQYSDLSDAELADGLYQKYYSDMDRAEFDAKIGLSVPAGYRATADDLFADLGMQRGTEQPQQPAQGGNFISRPIQAAADYLGDVSQSRFMPRAPGDESKFLTLEDFPDAAVRIPAAIGGGLAQFGADITSRPLNTIKDAAIQAATAPARTAEGINDANRYAWQGRFPEAGQKLVQGLTAAGETATMFAPAAGQVAARPASAAAKRTSQFIADAERVGIDPTAAAAYPRTAGAASKQLSENLAAGVTTRSGADKVLKQTEDAVGRVADKYAQGAGIADAGAAAREGASRFNSRSFFTPDESKTIREPARFSTFRDKAEAVYSKAYKGFNAESQSAPQNTLKALSEVNARFSDADLGALFELPTAKKLQSILEQSKGQAERTLADRVYQQALAVKSQARAQSGVSLADFVRKSGGVKDVGGDVLNALGQTVKSRPGVVNNKAGKQIDDLIVDAVEEGYFPEANIDQGIFPTQREFIDALTDDLQGRRVYALGDDAARADNAALDRLAAELDQMGVDYRAPHNDLVSQIEAATGETLSSKRISIADMRALRTEIREIQNSSKILKSRDDAALERLEGALTQDIYSAVEASGGKQALAQLKRADKYYRLGSERIRKALEPFIKDKATDETAFRAILNASRGQGKGNIQRLRALRRSLRPDEMDDISAGILREMGKAKEGADFSPEVFARAWADMGDEAKNVLFSRAQRPEVRQNLDALARVIDKQSRVEGLSNRSRSGANAQNFGTLVAFLAEPVTATTAIVGANGMGRLLMSPDFTKAMLRLQMNVPRATSNASNVAAEKARAIAIITAAEQADNSIKPYTMELKKALQEASNDNAQSQRATNQRSY